MSKRFIINADDFGLAEGANEGIMECYNRGAVTDMSLLAVGEAFGHAVARARENNIGRIGVHLALTDSFRPIMPVTEIPTLVNKDGRFSKGHCCFLAKYFSGSISMNEIYAELKSQISKVKKAGFAITHLDSHHHIHIIPGILKIVVKLMKEESVRYVRFPLERMSMLMKLTAPRAWARNLLLSSMCMASRRLLGDSGVNYNDYFIGHASTFKLKRTDLIFAISNLRDGITELG